jgi:hypothetical protein
MTGIKQIWKMALLTVALAMMAMAQPNVAYTVSGTITATVATGACTQSGTGCVVMPVNSQVQTVTWQAAYPVPSIATLSFEGTVDGVNWYAVAVSPPGSAAATRLTTAAGAGIWYMNASGLSFVRVRCSSYTSGSIAITGKRSSAVALVD